MHSNLLLWHVTSYHANTWLWYPQKIDRGIRIQNTYYLDIFLQPSKYLDRCIYKKHVIMRFVNTTRHYPDMFIHNKHQKSGTPERKKIVFMRFSDFSLIALASWNLRAHIVALSFVKIGPASYEMLCDAVCGTDLAESVPLLVKDQMLVCYLMHVFSSLQLFLCLGQMKSLLQSRPNISLSDFLRGWQCFELLTHAEANSSHPGALL